MEHHAGVACEAAPAANENNTVRRPFDTRALKRLPKPTERDPPYRAWWVVEEVDSSST